MIVHHADFAPSLVEKYKKSLLTHPTVNLVPASCYGEVSQINLSIVPFQPHLVLLCPSSLPEVINEHGGLIRRIKKRLPTTKTVALVNSGWEPKIREIFIAKGIDALLDDSFPLELWAQAFQALLSSRTFADPRFALTI